MRARLLFGCLLCAGGLLAGCHSTIEGTPVTKAIEPIEPDFPTARPTRSSPAPSSTVAAPPSARQPTGATPLEPQDGYVFIETKSGRTRCQLSEQDVGCESDFANAPQIDGLPANGVRVSAGGQMRWILGNLGAIPAVTLDYKRYTALGWTIDANSDGTRFTNNDTGHGMVVAVEGVQVF
ncbi:hypothetical protein [Mycolicibacterium goodii]|uniref:Lipoprotein LpqJ n=1 Tax=Mycolicibacterium goodii TaxID=134601 RepID=A0A0K0X0K6_MYCGD|nr:hypothetical protein AFA91_01900 [Mycolicibacterium goodii]